MQIVSARLMRMATSSDSPPYLRPSFKNISSKKRRMTGEVAKSFSVSQIIDKMCKKYGLVLHETPVGFKYLCR